jgi:hypothetical protein
VDREFRSTSNFARRNSKFCWGSHHGRFHANQPANRDHGDDHLRSGRHREGSNFIGGPVEPGAPDEALIQPLGVFVNTAVGNAFENQPGPASGKNTYVSAAGTYGNALFETQALGASTGGTTLAAGDDLIYQVGQQLIASRNGYLIMRATTQNGTYTSLDNAANASEVANGTTAGTTASLTIAILKMPPDSEQFELVYDQRI